MSYSDYVLDTSPGISSTITVNPLKDSGELGSRFRDSLSLIAMFLKLLMVFDNLLLRSSLFSISLPLLSVLT